MSASNNNNKNNNNTFDIDTNVDSYTNDELLEILELGSGSLTAEDIQDRVQLMMRQYPSIAFFFAQVGERLESEYADADSGDDVADEEGQQEQQNEEDEANVWLKNQYLRQDGAKEFKQYTSRDNKVQIFEDANNHQQMKQERLGAVNAINVPVSQGSLNPVLKNITSRIVMLDSTYRQNIVPYDSPVSLSTDYTLDLSDTLNNTLSIKLSLLLLLLGDATPLNLSVNLIVIFVHFAFLGDNVLDLAEIHFFETVEILDAALSDTYVDVDLVVFLF